MSELKLCQGPKCHTYYTQDRLKGIKGSKTYQTRRRSSLLMGEFCDSRCYYDWFVKHGPRAIDHFGRLTEPKHLTEQNAWVKGYDWNRITDDCEHHTVNTITDERRPLTEAQYNDTSYTLNER